MNLPSFLWLWKIAAWSMGLAVFAYTILAIAGYYIYRLRTLKRPRPRWLRPLHYVTGIILVSLVLLLLSIGLIGTIGYYGSLGHSPHLFAGLSVVTLVLVSAVTGSKISPKNSKFRSIHVSLNVILFLGFCWVGLSGWNVVQQYLP